MGRGYAKFEIEQARLQTRYGHLSGNECVSSQRIRKVDVLV